MLKYNYRLHGEAIESYFTRCLTDAQERLEAAERWERRFGAGSVISDAKDYAKRQVGVYANVVKWCN